MIIGLQKIKVQNSQNQGMGPIVGPANAEQEFMPILIFKFYFILILCWNFIKFEFICN